ncbi:MAG: hypothetical protein ABGY43_12100 [bacterium]
MSSGAGRPAGAAGEPAFELVSDFPPMGDQPVATRELVEGVEGDRTYKLPSGTKSEPGRYVKCLRDPVTGRAETALFREYAATPGTL